MLFLSLQGKRDTRANKTHLNWTEQLIHQDCNIFGLKTVSLIFGFPGIPYATITHLKHLIECNCNEILRQARQQSELFKEL